MNLFTKTLAGGVVLALLVAGCGGGDGETATSTTTAISKRVLVRKANAACKKDNEEIAVGFEKLGNEPGGDEVKFVRENVLPIREEQLRRLKELGPPAEDAASYEKLIAAMEEGIERAKKDPPSLVVLGDGYAFAKAFELGLAFGLERCWLN